MICPERQRLATAYQEAVATYGNAAEGLQGLDGVEFDKAYEITKKTWLAVDAARMALETHQKQYRC